MGNPAQFARSAFLDDLSVMLRLYCLPPVERAAFQRKNLGRLALVNSFRDLRNVIPNETHMIGTHHDNTDRATGDLVLILEAFVGRQQNIEPVMLNGVQKLAVLDCGPAELKAVLMPNAVSSRKSGAGTLWSARTRSNAQV